MLYGYHCDCGFDFDVVKAAADYDRPETCEKCGAIARREFAPQRVFFSGTRVEDAEYNPGLGCIVKNRQHRAEICKERGLVEIGNEKPETIHKHFDRDREERRERRWAEADKGWVGSE